MAIEIPKLIAAIAPDVYCKKEVRSEVKKIASEEGYLKAAEKAEIVDSGAIDFEKLEITNPFKLTGLKEPIEKHELVYDAFGKNLEPIYFWLIDTLNEKYGKSIKFIDNFIASPGSGYFSEMGGKATRMQEEAMKILGVANQLIKSILNIIYDLKEFEIRLSVYDKLKSKKKEERNAAILSLKQIWLDQVDMKRGNTSIKAMALGQGAQFTTLIDAFMIVENEKLEVNGKELDLNETVKRIVRQRMMEFLIWLKESEKELRKRFEIEKIYLRSQLNTVKMYARWAKPYLKAVSALEQRATANSSLVTAFNTVLFELVVMGEAKYDLSEDVEKGILPKFFKKVTTKKYHPIVIVNLNFRSIPERIQQGGYGFRGKVETTLTSYALTDEEIKVLTEEIEKDDVNDMMKQIEGATEESLSQINTDIEHYLGEEKKGEKKGEKTSEDNPFSALFSFFNPSKKEKEKEESKPSPDNNLEKVIRSQALIKGRKECRDFYNKYKNAITQQ